MARYDFWTHGVNTIVQFPERAKSISHSGLGIEIKQQGSPQDTNWLHVPIPSPTILDSKKVSVNRVRIRGSADQDAIVEEFQVLVDGVSKSTSAGLNITGRNFDHAFNAGDFMLEGGLVVSFRVKFLGALGTVTIRGVGVHFEQLPLQV